VVVVPRGQIDSEAVGEVAAGLVGALLPLYLAGKAGTAAEAVSYAGGSVSARYNHAVAEGIEYP